jgi:hypothetical protein
MPYLTPDTAPSDTICRSLVIPNDWRWISIVNGALSELMYERRFEQFGTATPEETAAVFQVMVDDFLVSECNPAVTYPKRAEISHATSTVLTGNAIAWNPSANQYQGGASRQNAAAINDEWTNSVYLDAGTYTVVIVGIGSAGSGILTWSIPSVYSVALDFYSAIAAVNLAFIKSVTLPTAGVYKISGKVASKHASSSGYACNITSMYFKPAAD